MADGRSGRNSVPGRACDACEGGGVQRIDCADNKITMVFPLRPGPVRIDFYAQPIGIDKGKALRSPDDLPNQMEYSIW